MAGIVKAFDISLLMFWEVLWPLILGFLLSAVVQSVVSRRSLSKLLGGESAKNIALATIFGMASSSCSYAAVALARSLFRKGASFLSSMVFEIASTNLVIELGIILIVLLGWQFTLAEFSGGIVMIILLSLIFKLTLTRNLISLAKQQTEKGLLGKMEGHSSMDMSLDKSFTAISHYFVMDWVSIWTDLGLGFLLAGLLSAFVPDSLWRAFFFTSNPVVSKIWGPLIGPVVAMLSFVCSVGNIPLAAVLWQGGISFGGVVSFIFADLIVLPILDIYRKYYGWKIMWYLLGVFYLTMVLAGLVVEISFEKFGLIPQARGVVAVSQGISWGDTTYYLNIIFLSLGAVLLWRFFKTNGVEMLKMMD